MPDKTISEATNKTTLDPADMLPLAVPNDDQAYHITGQNLFNSIPEGTTAGRGTVEIATDSEAAAGISVSKVVVPSGLLIRKTNTAILAGDLGGDARGVGSLDVQSDRSSAAQVASGEGAVAVGISEKAEGAGSVAVGISNNATGTNSVAVGYNVDATQPSAVSLGKDCTASADSAVAAGAGAVASAAGALALGKNAVARVAKTTNIAGPLITRKDNNETADLAFESFSAGVVTLMTKEIDLKVVATQTFTLPANCHFYPQRVGIICTMKSALSTRPRVQFGVVGDNQRLRSSTDALVDDKWQSYFWDCSPSTAAVDGTTTLTCGVSQAAVATTMRGRLWIQGLLVEDE